MIGRIGLGIGLTELGIGLIELVIDRIGLIELGIGLIKLRIGLIVWCTRTTNAVILMAEVLLWTRNSSSLTY